VHVRVFFNAGNQIYSHAECWYSQGRDIPDVTLAVTMNETCCIGLFVSHSSKKHASKMGKTCIFLRYHCEQLLFCSVP
jgi:hypothetical protein